MEYVAITHSHCCCCMLWATKRCQRRLTLRHTFQAKSAATSLQHPHHHRRIEDVPALLLTLRTVGLLWPCKPHDCPEGAGHQTLGPSRTESALVGLQHQAH